MEIGLNKICSEISSFVSQKEKRAEREKQQKKRKAEQDRVNQIIAAATMHKTSRVGQCQPIPSLESTWVSSTPVRVRKGDEAFDLNAHLDEPRTLKGITSVSTWRNSACFAVKLSALAGTCKESQSFKSEGRAQTVMLAKQRKEETGALLHP